MPRGPAASFLVLLLAAACTPTSVVESGAPAAPVEAGGRASATPSAESIPARPASDAASPSPAVSGSEPEIHDTIWTVIVTDLIVRSEPSVADPDTILPARLTEGDRLLVLETVAADGYEWVQVLPLRTDPRERPFGWVAMGSRDGEPWLAKEPLICPNPSSESIAYLELAPEERLACYGGETIEFTGEHGWCGIANGPVTLEPDWLIGGSACGYAPTEGATGGIALRFPPGTERGGGFPPTGATISGHHDDPAARSCVATSHDPSVPAPSREEVVAMCRTQFVVEEVRP